MKSNINYYSLCFFLVIFGSSFVAYGTDTTLNETQDDFPDDVISIGTSKTKSQRRNRSVSVDADSSVKFVRGNSKRAEEQKLRRTSKGSPQLVPLSNEDQIDDDYIKFLATIRGFQHIDKDFELIADPDQELRNITKEQNIPLRKNAPLSLPPGKYTSLSEIPFAIRKLSDDVIYPLEPQGWKLHVSAQPHSAQKVIALVMAVIDQDIEKVETKSGKKYKYTYFKVMSSIPAMRTMYYILGNLEGDGRETQVGKAMTIYPINKQHRQILVKNIDNVLLWAKKGGMLKNNDAVRPIGDADIGFSGFLSTRYGNLSSTKDIIRIANYVPAHKRLISPRARPKKPLNSAIIMSDSVTSFVELTDQMIEDDRSHPWPNYMNCGSWREKQPFPGLDLRWISPKGTMIRWDDRPLSWDNID